MVLFGDLTYTVSSRFGMVSPPGIPASGKFTMPLTALAAGQRFDAGCGTAVDVLGGLRAWDIDAAVTSPVVSASSSTTLYDPIVAVRVNSLLLDRWSVLSYLDVAALT